MQLDNISNIPKKIFNFFGGEAERLGKETGYKKRASKLTASLFIKALIASSISQQFTLEVFCSFIMQEGTYITKQSVFERFNERTVELVKVLSSSFLKQFKTEKLPQLKGLEQFSAIFLIDSSGVSLHSALNKLFKGSGGAASSAALKVQLMFDYLRGQIEELTLTSGCENDQGFDKYFNNIQEGALYLMDLGYFKLDSLKNIIHGKGFFLCRYLIGTKLFTKDKTPIDLLATLSTATALFSIDLLLGSTHQIPVRLIAQHLPKEIADRRRQKLKETHRRRGTAPSQESLALQRWSIYLTNTSEAQISHADIHQTYALRWQIELIFKLSKSLMHIDLINTRKSARVIIETYGKFISMMLFFFLCSPFKHHENKELSFYKACKILITKINDFIRSLSSPYRLKLFINNFYQALLLFAVKNTKKKTAFDASPSSGESF